MIRTVTGAALSIIHPDEDYETELRLNILCSIRGVGVPVASAILALVFPDKYAVMIFEGGDRYLMKKERLSRFPITKDTFGK